MKLSTLLIAGSLAVNAALLAVYVSRSHSDPGKSSLGASPLSETGAASGGAGAIEKKGDTTTTGAKSGAAVGTTAGTWTALKTGDLHALAARLRAAGFPPPVVRAVIGAQINESFRARREQLRPSGEERPFWKTDAGGGYGGYDPKYYASMRELGREQSKLLKEIMGADEASWGETTLSDSQRRRFGNLPSDKIEQLQRLDQDYNDLRNEVNMVARGIMLPEDRQKLALLEQEKRADLAQLLNPQEMEDYLMRSSQTTNRLRNALTTFNATEAEFRAIYQAQSAFDEKYNAPNLGMVNFTPDSTAERRSAMTRTNEQIKAELGEQRYSEYVRATDREFQQLNRMAQQSNLPETAALQVYDLRNNALKEANRIYEDAALNPEQKRAAIQALGQTARTEITTTLGAEAGARYLQVANRWLAGLDRGAAVSLTENGVSVRNVPPQRPNPNPAAQANSPAPIAPASK